MILDALANAGCLFAALPLVACFVASWRHDDPPPDIWILAVGFAVSTMADTLARDFARQGLNTWWLSYLWAPIQVGIWILAVARHRTAQGVFLVGLLLLAVASLVRGPDSSPETVVQVFGYGVLGYLVWGRTDLPHRRAIQSYLLGTMPFTLLMTAVPRDVTWWAWVWAAYQGVRVVALSGLTIGILEGRRGEPIHPTVGEGWRPGPPVVPDSPQRNAAQSLPPARSHVA